MSSAPSIPSRIRGSILGVATVDALGAPVEFKPRGSFPKIESMKPNTSFGLAAGTWTDDTSMTLCLAQSLIDHAGAFVARDQVRKYIDWYRGGYFSATGTCFDIGGATRLALETWEAFYETELGSREGGRAPDEVQREGQALVDAALKKKVFCGNGALMRVAPIGLVFHTDPAAATRYAMLSSELTHPYGTNAEACALYTCLLSLTMQRASKTELAAAVATFDLRDPDLGARLRRYRSLDDWKGRHEDGISSSGYVVSTLEAALWGFFTTDGFKEGAVRVVNLGNDADTVGAVYGGLAGAFYGVEAIPEEWRRGLVKMHVVEAVADGLVALAAR